jgi:hypothetical protein
MGSSRIKEQTVTTNLLKVCVPQVQNSQCPTCQRETRRSFLLTSGDTQFCCINGHEPICWLVPPKELTLSEADLVGLLCAWHIGNIPQCLEIVRKGGWKDST